MLPRSKNSFKVLLNVYGPFVNIPKARNIFKMFIFLYKYFQNLGIIFIKLYKNIYSLFISFKIFSGLLEVGIFLKGYEYFVVKI